MLSCFKRCLVAIVCVMVVVTLGGCVSSDTLSQAELVGKWRCELYGSELIIEFTPDNRFISHTDGAENCYDVDNGYIITYVEGCYDDGVKIKAELNDDVLIFGGVEYTPVEEIIGGLS